MPRYFFHIHDGEDIRDEDGSELGDLAAARLAAVQLAGACLRDHAAEFWTGEEWSMDVTDEAGRMLFSLSFVASDGPGVRAAAGGGPDALSYTGQSRQGTADDQPFPFDRSSAPPGGPPARFLSGSGDHARGAARQASP